MIYIDTGTRVKEFYTDEETDKAIEILLSKLEDVCSAESFDGYGVKVVDRAENLGMSLKDIEVKVFTR